MSMPLFRSWCSRGFVAVLTLALMLAVVIASAAPGGRGGGGRGGPGAGGGGRGGPGGPGGAAPRGGFQSGPGQAGPRPGSPGPGAHGVGGPGGVGGVGGPAGVGGVAGPAGVGGPAAAARPADVEKFLGTQPAPRPGSPATAATAQSMHATLDGRTQPFTASWYAEHPNAWRYAHPYTGDWWAVAGVAGVYAWLGYPVSGTAAATAAASTTGAAAQAAAPPADLEWLPLGVFLTGPKGTDQPHIYLQLAVSKAGEIKGNYYDSISDATQPITGAIDKDSRKATWSVGKGATFETTLDALLKTPSDVTMRAGSATQTWQLTQMEKPK